MVFLARLWSPLSDASRSPIDIASFEHEALASIIKTGAYESHVRMMRRLNAERRAVFLNALAEAFGDEVDIVGLRRLSMSSCRSTISLAAMKSVSPPARGKKVLASTQSRVCMRPQQIDVRGSYSDTPPCPLRRSDRV
ncbi:hypothetical protein EMEDMD4_1620001 [Sinorhizobium medicae]|uniref:Uncharacterized protein n=1 Tax=Sinorhizobium medicae TaxID=110321 RepID=A0A508WXV9_9HYPH|nr:hypothetical protein EMEDMD4_1620001 [Sinorhizobium medicae]